jgi:hypothetical protein
VGALGVAHGTEDKEWTRLVDTYGLVQATRFALTGERKFLERKKRDELKAKRRQANEKINKLGLKKVLEKIAGS